MDERGLIRLVTQFDPPGAQPAYATPSCGCSSSCCCCCCVGTAAASLSFTAVNVYSVAEREERDIGTRWVAGLLGGFALPAAVALAYFEESLAWLLAWPALVLVAYLLAQRSFAGALGRTFGVVLVAAVAGLVELAVGAPLLSTASLVIELVIGLGVAAATFKFAREW